MLLLVLFGVGNQRDMGVRFCLVGPFCFYVFGLGNQTEAGEAGTLCFVCSVAFFFVLLGLGNPTNIGEAINATEASPASRSAPTAFSGGGPERRRAHGLPWADWVKVDDGRMPHGHSKCWRPPSGCVLKEDPNKKKKQQPRHAPIFVCPLLAQRELCHLR